jgi:hypothetical protein
MERAIETVLLKSPSKYTDAPIAESIILLQSENEGATICVWFFSLSLFLEMNTFQSTK